MAPRHSGILPIEGRSRRVAKPLRLRSLRELRSARTDLLSRPHRPRWRQPWL